MRGTAGRIADDATLQKNRMNPNRSSKRPGRINLQAVSEVLAARGYDPTEEILKLLTPVVDEEGKELRPELDPDTRARMWNELLQYTQPKLKSVDVKVKGSVTVFDVTGETARKIAEEYLLAQAAGEDE